MSKKNPPLVVAIASLLEKVSPAQLLLLEPGEKYEVVADKAADLILLVHHMKGTAHPRSPDVRPASLVNARQGGPSSLTCGSAAPVRGDR